MIKCSNLVKHALNFILNESYPFSQIPELGWNVSKVFLVLKLVHEYLIVAFYNEIIKIPCCCTHGVVAARSDLFHWFPHFRPEPEMRRYEVVDFLYLGHLLLLRCIMGAFEIALGLQIGPILEVVRLIGYVS